MDVEAYRSMADTEAVYWWYRSRRELCLRQVERAAGELGYPAEPLRLLDYGCGTGYNLPLLARFGQVYGADHEQPFVKHPEFPRLALEDLEESGPFNVITLLDVLEHLEDDVAALRRLRSLLAPRRGQLVVTVPAYAWLWGDEDVLSHHHRRYTRQSLARTCTRAGFDVRFVSHFNLSVLPLQTAMVWAQRLRATGAPARTNVQPLPGLMNELLFRITAVEARLVGGERRALPLGSSIVCRLQPTDGARPSA
jgi:SAM-dependent methyltransferase